MGITRDIHPDTLSALQEAYFYHAAMVFFDWPDQPVYAHTGVGIISFDGHDWIGVGDFGRISLPEETSGLASFPAEFEIIGLDATIVDYLDDPVRNRDVKVYGAILADRSSNQVVGEPFEIWSGYADGMKYSATVQDNNGRSVLSHGIKLEARGGPTVRLTSEVYHTPEDQSTKYPGDTAGRWVINAEAEGQKLTWPES